MSDIFTDPQSTLVWVALIIVLTAAVIQTTFSLLNRAQVGHIAWQR